MTEQQKSEENQSMKKLMMDVLKDAVSESGGDADWENIVKKLSGSGLSSPGESGTEAQREQKAAKRKKIRDLKDRMKGRNEELAVLDPDQIRQTFHGLEQTLMKPDLGLAQGKYPCVTQAKAHINPSDPASIILGLNGVLPRWKRNSTINYAVYARNWPSYNHAVFAAYRLYEAAMAWNALSLGVSFRWVGNLEDACFVCGYGGNAGDTLARAFFPDPMDLNNMYVYQKAFDSGYVNYLYNVFLHELGHVLGLRHEFAPEREGGGPMVVWGTRNTRSVMSYTFPPQLQPSDTNDTKSFYAYTGTHIQGVPLKDIFPNN